MPDCRTVGELMKFLGEFPEDMPIFNGVHGQAATEVRGAHSGKKVLYLTFSGTPDEAFRPGGIWKQIDENRFPEARSGVFGALPLGGGLACCSGCFFMRSAKTAWIT